MHRLAAPNKIISLSRRSYTCTSINNYSLDEAFEIIARRRYSEYNFSDTPMSSEKLRKIIELTQLAPSSFNIQPYKMIIIQSADMKEALASAMLGANGTKVRNAAVTVVLAADRVPTRNVRKVMKLELESGKPQSYVSSLPSKITLILGEGWLSKRFRALGAHLASPLIPAPSISTNNDAWSMKNTALAAQQMMLAATALGVQSAAMEGFDERRVCSLLSIPMEDYVIPMIISLGYSKDTKESIYSDEDRSALPVKGRFPMSEVCYSEKFGQDLKL